MYPHEYRTFDTAKRVFDIVAATTGLVATAPVQLVVAAAVRITHGHPVLFRQPRPGLGGEVFELVKFRTMLHPSPTLRSDAQRLTPLGRFLRSTSLDELPTLWNVLRGHMSIVGPRPLRTHYLPLYNQEQARRHEVRPGITGLAQSRGRNLLSWGERFALDVEYVDDRSPILDLKILYWTSKLVIRRTGISAHGEATMQPFTGEAIDD